MAKLTVSEVIEFLKESTMLELNDLIKAVEEEFGVTAAAPVAVAAGAAPEAEAASGPSEVTVTIKELGAGASKVALIKVVREITGLGMMDAKKMVDNLPAAIKENIKPEEAEEIKSKLVEAGAVVEVK